MTEKIDELAEIDPNSKKAGVFRERISKSLQYYSGTLTSWLKDHSKDLRDQIEENSKGLYIKLYDLENYLSFNEFRAIDTIQLERLSALCDIINDVISDESKATFLRRILPRKIPERPGIADTGGGKTTSDTGGGKTTSDTGGGKTTSDTGGGKTTSDTGGGKTTSDTGGGKTTSDTGGTK